MPRKFKRQLSAIAKKINKLPKEITISAAVFAVFGLTYVYLYCFDTPVAFSYSGATCVRHVSILPAVNAASGSFRYDVRPANQWKVGGVPVIALAVCFIPKDPPVQGRESVAWSPWGAWVMRKTFTLTTPAPATANVGVFANPVPLSKPLVISLSVPDKVFSYSLRVDGKQALCQSKKADLYCEVQGLKLGQGKTYQAELVRYFNGKQAAVVVRTDITTLASTHVVDGSVKVDETIYTKPKVLSLAFDKPLVKAQVALVRREGDKQTVIPVTSVLKEKSMEVTISEDLPRSADYMLTVDGLEAQDGSTLDEPYQLPFKTSGGPRVTSVNVGRTGIATGATVVVSFDQPLSDGQDISRFISLAGGVSLVSKRGNQLLFSLGGVPKCGDFTIKTTNDIASNYEVAGDSAWSFTGRMVCHTVGVIGYSSRGRPIYAYYFGSGTRAVLFTGAIHGSEIGTRLLMDRWIQELEAGARNIPADKMIVVVPQVNPDGVAAGTRVNARNVDLNRNFATSDWQKDVLDVNNNPFPGGGGEAPMSEPETRAIGGLAQRLGPVVVLSYHSIGGVVLGNLAGNSGAYAAAYSQLSGYQNATGNSSGTFDYAVSGTADDWYAAQGIASLVIELSSHTSSQFDRNRTAMWYMVGL